VRLLNHILQFYFTFLQENVHPLQGGYFRRKLRRERRAGLPRETRWSSTRAGSARLSKLTSSSPASISICTASAAASNATRADTATLCWRQSTALLCPRAAKKRC